MVHGTAVSVGHGRAHSKSIGGNHPRYATIALQMRETETYRGPQTERKARAVEANPLVRGLCKVEPT